MSSALIINAYSARNAGDAAIVLSTAHVLRKKGYERITVSSRHYREDSAFYARHGLASTQPVFSFSTRGSRHGIVRALSFFMSLIAVLALIGLHRLTASFGKTVARVARQHGLFSMLSSDVVVICGGGYMYSAKRKFNLALVHSLISVRLAALAGKSILMMPQSIGPLTKHFDERLIRFGLSSVDPIVVRDDESFATAQRLFGASRLITMCPDVAFFGWENDKRRSATVEPLMDRPRVGIVVMDWTWARVADASRLDLYIERIAYIARELAATCDVYLMGHSTIPEHHQDDLVVARRTMQVADSPHVYVEQPNDSADGIRAFMLTLDAVISTRLHGCIIALECGVSAVALSYQPKATGTFTLLGLTEFCLDVDEFDPDMVLFLVRSVLRDGSDARRRVTLAVDTAKRAIELQYGLTTS